MADQIVSAVVTAAHSETPGLGEALEAALKAVVEQSLAEGISIHDTGEILRRKAIAQQYVLEQFDAD